jgi:hypothetical protein
MVGDTLTPQYAAGFLDGEGCFLIAGGSDGYGGTPRVSVRNTYLPILEAFATTYGGTVRQDSPSVYKKNRTTFCWTVYGQRALDVVDSVLPYLHEKKPQAELLREFRRWQGGSEAARQVRLKLKNMKRIDYGDSRTD